MFFGVEGLRVFRQVLGVLGLRGVFVVGPKMPE